MTGPAVAECNDPADCEVWSDCCSCLGLPSNEMPPKCDAKTCLVDTCTSLGMPFLDGSCTAGRCTAFSCDPKLVTCKMAEPTCPPGQVPAVYNECWASCVPANDCGFVSDCSRCDPKSEVCVTETSKGGQVHHCVEIAPSCAGKPTCACMGASVCTGVFDVCNDGPDGITCGCTTC